MDTVALEKEAMQLSDIERALLADRLLQTLGSEDDAILRKWGEEAECRLDAYLAGTEKALDGQKVLSELRAGYS